MRYLIIFLPLLLFQLDIVGQTTKTKSSLSIELIPVAFMMTVGSGINATYGIEKHRFLHQISIGFLYNNYNTGLEREYFTSGGVPLAQWSTEVDIETSRPYPLGGIVNNIDFNNLDRLGVKQFKPKIGYRLNRSFSYELLYQLAQKRIQLYAGLGVAVGLTTRDDTHVGFTGTIINEFNGQSERFWVNINIRAKYLYLGSLGKVTADYSVTDHLRLGITGGLQYLFDRQFREDIKIPYLALVAKAEL